MLLPEDEVTEVRRRAQAHRGVALPPPEPRDANARAVAHVHVELPELLLLGGAPAAGI